MAKHVHLDAMIRRADFATDDQDFTMGLFKDFPISNLEESSPILTLLRKPDFQRETNHWSPQQIVTFIASFLDNQLIPALILWKAPRYIFVIDGGHRLSALRAWMLDDYGDGPTSSEFFGGEISEEQKRMAKRTRSLIEREIGRYTTVKALIGASTATPEAIRRSNNLVTRALDLQWVQGNADVAETSFFNINSQGTPLDDVESTLIKNRNKAVAIASRAILRAGSGHKYWSRFPEKNQKLIEELASEFHNLLFDPEAESPIKTLDLPLGGSVSPVDALELLIDFLLIASAPQVGVRVIGNDNDDLDGSDSIDVLTKARKVASWIVGNDSASLGLHPAVYFYNERGAYSRHLFLGMVNLIAEKLKNNDTTFFRKFTEVRGKLEEFLVANKSLLTQAFANTNREARVVRVHSLLGKLVDNFTNGNSLSIEELFAAIGLKGRILDVENLSTNSAISKNTKSAVYLRTSLAQALRCPVCNGYLYPRKSVSYDHVRAKRDGGDGSAENTQMVHPYCNSAIKQ